MGLFTSLDALKRVLLERFEVEDNLFENGYTKDEFLVGNPDEISEMLTWYDVVVPESNSLYEDSFE